MYNLCSEREYDAYEFESIGGHVENRIAFDDHNPPPLVYIVDFCRSLDEWLSANYYNVAGVHCKAGKGRTGTMIACYLLWSGVCNTAEDALRQFDAHRTRNNKGVTIPSQKRFVQYFEQCVKKGSTSMMSPHILFPENYAVVRIDKIIMQTIPHFDNDGGCDPYVIMDSTVGTSIFHNTTKKSIEYNTWDYRKSVSKLEHYNPKKHDMIILRIDQEVTGNVKLFFYDEDKFQNEKMFTIWINTSFLDPKNGILRLQKMDIDRAIKDRSHRLFDATFTVELYYTVIKESSWKSVPTPVRHTLNIGSFGSEIDVNTI
jgi:phosphatidylinositol-3,4,5-trisphosphate 3-phosphatase/dual-specificity protein phosphatase PTEN